MDIGTEPDEVVVLTSADDPPRRQTKVMQVDDLGWQKIDDAENAYLHSGDVYAFGSLDDIWYTLEEIAALEHIFAIPGDIIPGTKAPFRRLSAMTHGDDRTIQSAPRIWMAVDIDSGVQAPEDWLDEPEALVQRVIEEVLPEAFHRAGCVWKWSSQMTPGAGTARGHGFFLLKTPLHIEQVKQWIGELEHVDDSILKPGQPIYTANPRVVDGDGCVLEDSLGDDRRLILDGPPVSVPLSVSATPAAHCNLQSADDGHDPDDVWLPAIPEDEMLIRLDHAIQRCGHQNIRVPDGEMRRMYEGMRDLQFRYLCETYGRPREKEWLRQLTERTLRRLCIPDDNFEKHLRDICGRKFDEAWRGGIPKARLKALQQNAANPPMPDDGPLLEREPEEEYRLSDAELGRLLPLLPSLPAIARRYEQAGEHGKAKAIRDLWREKSQ